MKIVRKSNFDHEDYRGNQWFVAQRLSAREAARVASVLNDLNGQHGDDFFEVVSDDYILPPDWTP